MSIHYPSQFPNPTIQDYGLEPQESIARTKMDSGVARQRRRFTSVPSNVAVRWIMTADIFGLFEAWYRYKAKEGAEWIIIPLQNGLGYQNSEARFVKPYTAKMLSSDLWEVTTSLEVRQMSVLSEGALDIILSEQFTVEGLEKCSTDLHHEINTVLPTIDTW